jgi:hypothetical protein
MRTKTKMIEELYNNGQYDEAKEICVVIHKWIIK